MAQDHGGGSEAGHDARRRRPYRPLIALLVLLGIFCIYAASDGWHLSCHLFDAKCVRVLGLNFGQSITANGLTTTQSTDTTTATTTDTSTDTTPPDTTGTVNGVPTQTPGNPIRVDCPLSSAGAVEISSCFWVVGPGTGAEQSAPPSPQPGAQYNPDQGEVCIWHDAGKDDTGTGEFFTCDYPP